MQLSRTHLTTTLPLLAVSSFIAACSSDDDIVITPNDPDPAGGALTTYYAKNASGSAGSVGRGNQGFVEAATFASGANEGIDLDYYGNLYQAGDGTNGPELRIISNILGRADMGTFDAPDTDRVISGASTTLMNPKGIHIVHGAGIVLVADVGTGDVVVFGTSATGDVAPLATTTLANSAWDIFHDETNDRLFLALTNGTVGVIDTYAAGGFMGTLTRTITPDDGAGGAIGTNLHGIAYDSANDTLVVSDVGVASGGNFDTDGSIYVFSNASTADGMTAPDRVIEGANTLLGNPVDIALDGERLRVAEKANAGGQLLIFNDVLTGTGTDVAPDVAVACASVESITTEVDMPTYASEASDLDGTGNALTQVMTTQNDSGNVALNDLRRHDATTLAENLAMATDSGVAVESLDIDVTGNVYLTADDGAGTGSILVINRGATARGGENFSASRDRSYEVDELMTPKGIEVVSDRGLIMVADTGAMGIFAFPMEGASITGTSAASVVSITTTAAPWDLDYDGTNDRLFVALTDGTVAVFDDLLDGAMTPTMADRSFSIDDPGSPGTQYSVNMHGIVYDAENDRLMVSDVNVAAGGNFDTDGRIFVVENASTASGLVTPSVHIEGAATLLGNPVDLAFDGVDLLVAEKANAGGQILRFDGIAAIDTTVSMDVAPDVSVAAAAVESIAAVPTGLAPTSGGSIEAD